MGTCKIKIGDKYQNSRPINKENKEGQTTFKSVQKAKLKITLDIEFMAV